MRPVKHVLISTGVSALFAIWARSWYAVAACFLSGIFIDLDHHLDYYIATKEIPLNIRKFLKHFDTKNKHRNKMYLFLHSYEFLFLFWLCVFIFNLNIVWLGIAVGFTTHVLCDEIANPISPLAYFLFYRMKKNFDCKHLMKPNAGEKYQKNNKCRRFRNN